jgi:hypothetical protein
LTGQQTEAVYRRYAVTGDLGDGVAKPRCAAARGHGHDRDKKGRIEGVRYGRAIHETQEVR